jgi:ubiquinone/menaquinone biosynthesis C-methylase UbiE
MSLISKQEFKSFFQQHAQNVNNAEKQGFWLFSDTIIEMLILEHFSHLTSEDTLLDAGGGTGRWIEKLANKLACKFTLFDKSEDMLAKAVSSTELQTLKTNNRISFYQGDLEDMSMIADNSISGIISTYNPLSFVDEPNIAIGEMYRILKPGSQMLVMVMSRANTLFSKINNFMAEAKEINWMTKESKVKWANYTPSLHTFSRRQLQSLVESNNLNYETCYGVPLYLQPQSEDFDPTNQARSKISQKLMSERGFWDSQMSLQFADHQDPELVNRGMNLFFLATKKEA